MSFKAVYSSYSLHNDIPSPSNESMLEMNLESERI
jgi:hypothetical protein